jgi:hypothetical protein
LEWLIVIGAALILDILALEHLAAPRSQRDKKDPWPRL